MNRALLAAAVLFVIAPLAAAAPRAKSPEECAAYADMALVAATLAKHGIAREKTDAMLPDMYSLASEDARAIAAAILDAAYRAADSIGRPLEFALALGRACERGGGNMDSVLGTRL